MHLQTENVVTLLRAAKSLPELRRGRRPHVSTLYRWASAGVRGVRLETMRVGGTLCTSLEALQRFCERLSAPNEPTSEAANPNIHRELDAAGL